MPAPQPSTQPDRAVLAGTVERVTFHNAESGFCVLRIKARAHRNLVTIVGHAATIAAGEWRKNPRSPPRKIRLVGRSPSINDGLAGCAQSH